MIHISHANKDWNDKIINNCFTLWPESSQNTKLIFMAGHFAGIFRNVFFFAARLGEESWNPRRIMPRHKMRSSVAISGCLRDLKRFIGNYCMKIKGKQTEKLRETSIKTADTLRLSASLHNSVFCRSAAWAHCTCGFWSNYCATFSRNFQQFTFFLPLLSTVDKKAARRILRQANLLARMIELNNEILFPWWPCTIESRASIHRNNIEAWSKSSWKKEKNQFVRFYRVLVITAARVGKSNIQVKCSIAWALLRHVQF